MKKLIKAKEDALSHMNEDDFIREISDLKAKGAVNIALELEYDWDNAYMVWSYEREETDQEYETRLKLEEKERIARKAATEKKQAAILKKREKDRALYEKLKKEFEGA